VLGLRQGYRARSVGKAIAVYFGVGGVCGWVEVNGVLTAQPRLSCEP
jgi:hypothetical protein